MTSDTDKNNFTGVQLVRAIAASVLCGLVMVEACIVKYYVIGSPVTAGVWFCMLTLGIIFAVFLSGLLMFAVVSRTFIIRNTRYYVAFLTTITIAFLVQLYLSTISPLLIAPGLTATVIIQLSRRRQDAFIFNLTESVMLFCALVFESVITEGEVFALVGGGNGWHIWFVVCMTVLSIGAGAYVPLFLREKTRRISYLFLGLSLTSASVVLYVVMSLVYGSLPMLSYSWLVAIAGITPYVLSQVLNPALESGFNLVTDNRLVELTNTRQPLLRRLATEAPGTYNHSLAVANFAGICANAIGEDPYLARAAAYYHDVGKLVNPTYFAENQAGYNPHDDILPEVSAEIIRSHTTEGYKLLKSAGLPEEIASVAIEHHGTLPITVFYERAKKLTDSEVDIRDYSYHGNTPTTRIAAIIMICDSSEAAIRAMDKPDGERVDKLLRSIIHDRINRGQFDKCPISLMDLDIIRRTIVRSYGGLFHKRVKYPGGEKD